MKGVRKGDAAMFHDHEADYHARRAREEAVRAIAASDTAAAAIHQELCLRYSGRVIAALILTTTQRVRERMRWR